MKLKKIRGNTYYIPSNTNIGIYSYKNKNCVMIDTGINNTAARKIEKVILNKNLHPKYIINTHNHIDHCGGNNYFTENYPGCITYTSKKEKLFMENEELYPYTLFGAYPIKKIIKSNKPINVDYILNYGTNKIDNEKINIIPLKGHSIEQIGIITPEKVCFLGDSIFSEDILQKYSFPYLYNVEDSLNTLDYIKEIDSDVFILSHSDKIYSKEEIINLSQKNIEMIQKHIKEIQLLLEQPQTRESLLESILILNEIPNLNFNQYHLYFCSVSAFISYLYNKNILKTYIENANLYYYKNS